MPNPSLIYVQLPCLIKSAVQELIDKYEKKEESLVLRITINEPEKLPPLYGQLDRVKEIVNDLNKIPK